MKTLQKRRNGLSFALILAGGLLIAGVLAREAFLYPWATVFGGAQTASALPDPPPIAWESGDEAAAGSAAPSSSVPELLPGDGEPKDAPPARYAELGVIKIPKLNLSQHVLEGTEGRQMHYGVGHVSGTAVIGGEGNCALAGHNTTSFRYLDKLSEGDAVFLEAGKKTFSYSIFETLTVPPTETEVLDRMPGESATLTLITCTPYLTGANRLIVRARLTSESGSRG